MKNAQIKQKAFASKEAKAESSAVPLFFTAKWAASLARIQQCALL
jgi:hypothetical protein